MQLKNANTLLEWWLNHGTSEKLELSRLSGIGIVTLRQLAYGHYAPSVAKACQIQLATQIMRKQNENVWPLSHAALLGECPHCTILGHQHD